MHRFLLLSILLYLISSQAWGQSETYFIFSNIERKIDTSLFNAFQSDIEQASAKTTIISLGDNDIQSLKLLKSVSRDSKVKLIGGDLDHKDLSGLKKLDDQKSYKLMTEGLYCPDPVVKEIDDYNVIIAINSNWFLDRDLQFKAKDKDCVTFNEADFFEELESIIEDYEESNIFILAHHTIESNTKLNGKNLWLYNMVPIVGNLYASHKKNIGQQQDMTSTRYNNYVQRMLKLEKYHNVTVITGHDKTNSIYKRNQLRSVNINSGKESYSINKNAKFATYQNKLPSYIKLDFIEKMTRLIIVNEMGRDTSLIIPKINISLNMNQESEITYSELEPVQASEKYESNRFKNWLMGSGYREAWSTPVKAPRLIIEEHNLSPYARGGGGQTQSVKFKNAEKRKYAFRALDKEPEKALNEKLKKSIYKKVVQELITTMHPYAPLVVQELIKETDIIHIAPELYIMASGQNGLNSYRDFDNKIGTLEEKPKGKGKKREGYKGADQIVSTHQMLADLISNPNYILDKDAFAKARVFDMYIGDWDKHEDNWKWAIYKDGKKKLYIPIPKDRDHAFSKWTGFIPKAADYIAPAAEHFDERFGNLKQLNFQAQYLDRQLSSELDAEDWQKAVEYINSKMTDGVIENSVNAFPPEVKDFYDDEIVRKLKARRLDLGRAVFKHYRNISSEVNVVGSNKRDFFEIMRKENGNVEISVYESDKMNSKRERYYHREFTPDYTKTIYCFALDGKDIIELHGNVENSIKIRIIGGDDEDQIIDNSSVKGKSKLTQIYDRNDEDLIQDLHKEVKIKKPSRPNYYEPYAPIENTLLPLVPSIRKSPGNGWGLDLGFQYYTHEYNKPNFAQHYKFNFRYYPQINAYSINGKYRYTHIIGLTDLVSSIKLSDEYDRFQYFYGLGSKSTFDDEARENGVYQMDYDYGRYDIGLSKAFFGKSDYTNTLFIEYHGIDPKDGSGIEASSLPEDSFFYGYQSSLSFDFTDQTRYPTDGNKFNALLETRISSQNNITAKILSDISYYKSLNLSGITTTLAARFGYQVAFGEANFYHLSTLGSNIGLSGYTRNRFLDKYATYYNTELRFNLGTMNTPLIPMEVGTFLLYEAGKVWNDNSSFGMNDWKSNYGIGFFIAPYSTDYALSYSLIRSNDFKFYSQFQLGFSF